MNKHWFKIELNFGLPRTMTKTEYKAISRWLRLVRRAIEDELPTERLIKNITELMSTGECVL